MRVGEGLDIDVDEIVQQFPRIEEDERDGVRILWADIPGPFQAALMFRVGRADESLPNSGITHLVEHLACPRDQSHLFDFDATVDLTRTFFFARGQASGVASFLDDVCQSLAELPVENLRQEANVLLTEESSAGTDPVSALLRVRFGSRTYAVVGHDQIGLNRINGAELRDWAATYFCRDNAILCLSGRPSDDLRLPLPGGRRIEVPPVTPVELPLPGWFNSLEGVVAVGVLGPRKPELGVGLRIVEQRVRRTLRHDAGVTYAVATGEEPLDSRTLHRVLVADCMYHNAGAVRDGIVDTLAAMVNAGPTQEEIWADSRTFVREVTDPAGMFGWLDFRAEAELAGADHQATADVLHTRLAIEPASVRDAVAVAAHEALLLLPDGIEGPASGWHPTPALDDQPLIGKTYMRAGIARFSSRERIVVGSEGFSFRIHESKQWLTMRWSDVEALIHYRPDVVLLLSGEGRSLELVLSTFADPDGLLVDLQRRVPISRQITLDVPAGDGSSPA